MACAVQNEWVSVVVVLEVGGSGGGGGLVVVTVAGWWRAVTVGLVVELVAVSKCTLTGEVETAHAQPRTEWLSVSTLARRNPAAATQRRPEVQATSTAVELHGASPLLLLVKQPPGR
jgi:hypothetical protein